jgi:hypothetical protein
LIFGVAAASVATVYALSGDALEDGPSASAPRDKPRSSDAAEPGGGALRAEVTAMRGAVQQLGRTNASLQRDLDRAAAERAAADAAREAAAETARVEAEDPTAADREASEMASRSDAKLLSEPVDKEWSREKHEQLAAFFARPPLTGTKLKAVDCRTTMCRVQLAHASNADRGRFIQSFSDLAGPTGMVFAHIETADDLEVEVYVTRDGVALP